MLDVPKFPAHSRHYFEIVSARMKWLVTLTASAAAPASSTSSSIMSMISEVDVSSKSSAWAAAGCGASSGATDGLQSQRSCLWHVICTSDGMQTRFQTSDSQCLQTSAELLQNVAAVLCTEQALEKESSPLIIAALDRYLCLHWLWLPSCSCLLRMHQAMSPPVCFLYTKTAEADLRGS